MQNNFINIYLNLTRPLAYNAEIYIDDYNKLDREALFKVYVQLYTQIEQALATSGDNELKSNKWFTEVLRFIPSLPDVEGKYLNVDGNTVNAVWVINTSSKRFYLQTVLATAIIEIFTHINESKVKELTDDENIIYAWLSLESESMDQLLKNKATVRSIYKFVKKMANKYNSEEKTVSL